MPLPTMTSGSLMGGISYARFGEARRAHRQESFAQVVPPCQRYAADVECKEDLQRQVRSSRGGDRGPEAAGYQIAAAGADRSNESQRGGALDAGRLKGKHAAGFAETLRLLELLLTEDRRNHPIGRAVAHSGRDELDQEHREKAGELLDFH